MRVKLGSVAFLKAAGSEPDKHEHQDDRDQKGAAAPLAALMRDAKGAQI
jgi:hypothetical protein